MGKKIETRVMGIINITEDSFSDGGLYLEEGKAIDRGLELIEGGVRYIDIGAESSYPGSEKVGEEEELKRLLPVIKGLRGKAKISVDTYKPEVMQGVLEHGVDIINDITGLKNIESIELISEYQCEVVIMFSKQLGGDTQKTNWSIQDPMGEIIRFFDQKLNKLLKHQKIKEKKIILDPGMGFFLSIDSKMSLKALKDLNRLKNLNKKILISVSKKSFIGEILYKEKNPNIKSRTWGSLGLEIYLAIYENIDYIRTHSAQELIQALKVIQAVKDS